MAGKKKKIGRIMHILLCVNLKTKSWDLVLAREKKKKKI